ncbi:MAG TPA: bifunctional DNA primase/polymerase [Thermoguttaceae bacterium]|nr:bifunctional DNA primase/polymerase [Thermoguttaceae bacterium]HUX16045.1 bifunctional DNA primase/polymerase [Phycisphaerae bacterium]
MQDSRIDTSDMAEQQYTGENYETYRRAMDLHSLGYSLIPISRWSKKPIVKWKRFQTERCSTADVLAWFGRGGCRIGIVTGQLSGIVVVDCDDLDAIDALLDDSLRDGGLEESRQTQRTKRGMHFFFRHPGTDTRNGRGFLGAKIDVRGDGGYVLAYEDASFLDRREMPLFRELSREAADACEMALAGIN